MEMKLLLLQIQVSIAVIFILLIRQGMKKMPKIYSYGLWLLVFARLLCPEALESRISFMPSVEQGSAWVERIWENSVYREEFYESGYVRIWNENTTGTGLGEESIITLTDSVPADMPYKTGESDNKIKKMNPAAAMDIENSGNVTIEIILFSIWILGAAIILGKNGMLLARMKDMVRGAVRLDDPHLNTCPGRYRRYADRNVYLSNKIAVPFTLGFFRPRIYLPAAVEDNEREYIICHESVHIRRKDYIVKNIAFLLLALNWLNPFIWAAFHFMERDMEMSCDEKVVKLMGSDIKRQYSQSLLDFALEKGQMAATPLTFGENRVKERVKNILMFKNAKKWSVAAGTAVILAAGILLFTTRAESAENFPRDPGRVYKSDLVTLYRGEEQEEVEVQLCENGVFRLDKDGIFCLYPYPVSENAYSCIQDGILYFTLIQGREEKSGEDGENGEDTENTKDMEDAVDRICMVDVKSGEYDDETLLIQSRPVKMSDIDMLHIGSGYVIIYKKGEDIYIPQVNTGEDSFYTVHRWKDKTAAELDEEEQNAYGTAVREYLLDNPGLLVNLSNRTIDETFIYIDLDGDGYTEKIILSEYPSVKSRYYKYGEYQLQTGDSIITGSSYGLDNNIWAFGMDGSRILLALRSDFGTTQETVLFSYDNGELREIGKIDYDIKYCTIENGVIESCAFLYDVLMPMDLKIRFRIDEEGMLEQEPQETYEFYSPCNGKLLVSLPVHNSPGGEEVSDMEPQSVRLTKIDKTFQWIYLEGENGEGGWFQVDGEKGSWITELNLDSVNVFELYYAG